MYRLIVILCLLAAVQSAPTPILFYPSFGYPLPSVYHAPIIAHAPLITHSVALAHTPPILHGFHTPILF
ncbi:hypothetical protein B5X24_HaOG205741 [Helicoverpa armigera]|uniref:Uncharacterized protein n=1 Tax=Helicoverpa armigera TaxID=29058 RepID=A0A2W1BKZ7_HELAM|nr:hypothetical protein B5X24_HaOG205741 [Helicoverpa armigera]